MAKLNYKTRGMSSPQGKPKVYFICHPLDFKAHFEVIQEDILRSQNCAVWYDEELPEAKQIYENMREPAEERVQQFGAASVKRRGILRRRGDITQEDWRTVSSLLGIRILLRRRISGGN